MLCLRRKFVGCFSSSRGAIGVCVESLLGTRGHREEGSPGTFQIRTESQRGRFDSRNPRRGFIGHFTNLHGATARALGRAGSLQRVHRALSKFARRRSEGALTRAILAEASLGTLRICTAPQRERLGRGFIGRFTNSHGATVGALRSLQRVHRAQHEHAKRGER